MGSPLPLGFFAFAVGSFVFTGLELEWVDQTTQARPLAIIMLAFVAPLEVIPAVLAFFTRDAASGTALGLFGMLWAATGAVMLSSSAPRTPMLGVFLLAMCAVIGAFGVISIAGKPILAAVAALACVRFALTGVYHLEGGKVWEHASGWVGLPLSAIALYLAVALLLEDVQHHTVLPLGRRGGARRAIESHLDDQVAGIVQEAGVRDQL